MISKQSSVFSERLVVRRFFYRISALRTTNRYEKQEVQDHIMRAFRTAIATPVSAGKVPDWVAGRLCIIELITSATAQAVCVLGQRQRTYYA